MSLANQVALVYADVLYSVRNNKEKIKARIVGSTGPGFTNVKCFAGKDLWDIGTDGAMKCTENCRCGIVCSFAILFSVDRLDYEIELYGYWG